ncbi:hypothetical protein PG985_005232 [Apiospora marii]|uniref:Uncharacterized protein n=1 Tax=Apiospora marii TaxID=335849 RepID=A0ABR1SBH6_9PEZI
MTTRFTPACTFRNYLCAKDGCNQYALEPCRRAACVNDKHTEFCLANLVGTLALRRQYPNDAVKVVGDTYGPGFPESMYKAPAFGERDAQIGYCAEHGDSDSAAAADKAKFWGQRGTVEEKREFVEGNAVYVEMVCKWRSGLDLKGLLKVPVKTADGLLF